MLLRFEMFRDLNVTLIDRPKECVQLSFSTESATANVVFFVKLNKKNETVTAS